MFPYHEKKPKEDSIYRPKPGEPDIEDRASVFHTEFASPRLETPVDPGKRAGKNMNITEIIMANLNYHNKLRYGDRPVTEAAPEFMTQSEQLYCN